MYKEELISVIIPVYNVEEYLPKCIESAQNQTYQNLEIILINDGSSDNSAEVCDEFAERDNRIRVIHQENQGISVVRNRGVQEAKGEYLCWIDSDDYIASTMIEELYNLLKQYNADMSICNYTQGSERVFVFDDIKDENVDNFGYQKGLELIYENHHYSFIMAASWAKIIKKSLYQDLEYPNGKIFEDIYMSHKLISRCENIVYTDKVMYYYYQWPESILGKKLYKAKLDYLGAFEERIHFYKKLNLEELSEEARIQYLHSLIWEYSRAKDILKDAELVKKIKCEYRKYYRFGSENKKVKHETKRYMLSFYFSPYIVDFIGKVKTKLGI